MKRLKSILRKKEGATLVETMVCLLLISIMLAMAASSLSAASHVFVRVQKTQYAQSILDTTMTELRTITKNASGYVKIYDFPENSEEKNENITGNITESTGNLKGNTVEFINEEGYVVLVSTNGCDATDLYIQNNKTGQAAAVDSGQLLTRYYFRNSSENSYVYLKDGVPVARAVATVFGKGFYMGNYLEVTYSFPAGTKKNDELNSITATVTLYRDKELTDVVATDSEILEFKHSVICCEEATAKEETTSNAGE